MEDQPQSQPQLGATLKAWIAAHKKWIFAAMLILGVAGEYATGTVGVEDAVLRAIGIVKTTQGESPAIAPMPAPAPAPTVK